MLHLSAICCIWWLDIWSTTYGGRCAQEAVIVLSSSQLHLNASLKINCVKASIIAFVTSLVGQLSWLHVEELLLSIDDSIPRNIDLIGITSGWILGRLQHASFWVCPPRRVDLLAHLGLDWHSGDLQLRLNHSVSALFDLVHLLRQLLWILLILLRVLVSAQVLLRWRSTFTRVLRYVNEIVLAFLDLLWFDRAHSWDDRWTS